MEAGLTDVCSIQEFGCGRIIPVAMAAERSHVINLLRLVIESLPDSLLHQLASTRLRKPYASLAPEEQEAYRFRNEMVQGVSNAARRMDEATLKQFLSLPPCPSSFDIVH